jgi:CTD nuclear envelope phosphatase 1
VIFTASVQEYADPVIDWLEAERKIFKARYYRQHCTVENGAYIKDLSVVERDLGKVCILDNSPISYAWHEGSSTAYWVMLTRQKTLFRLKAGYQILQITIYCI